MVGRGDGLHRGQLPFHGGLSGAASAAATALRPEGTYLVWLDCRALGLDEAARRDLLLGEARVFIEEGEIFGPEGAGFERLNLACPRAILAEALERIRRVVTARPGATARPS